MAGAESSRVSDLAQCVTVLLFLPRSVVILTRSRPALRGIMSHIYFSSQLCGFVGSYARFVFVNQTSLVQNPSLFDDTRRLHVYVQSSATHLTCLYTTPSHSARPCLCSMRRSLNTTLCLFLSSRSPSTWPICLDAISSLGVSSAIATRSVMLSRTGPRVAHLIGTSQTSIHPSSIEALALPCSCHVIYGYRVG